MANNEVPCGELPCGTDGSFGSLITGSPGTAGAGGAGGTGGAVGPTGATGATGATGPAGPSGSLGSTDFFALMPGDNAATVAVGAAVQFPQNGPTTGVGITRLSASTFNLAAIGVYQVTWQASVSEPGQLAVALGGVIVATTVVGRATGTTQIVGSRLISTSVINSVLSIINPPGNAAALTMTPIAGGASAVSASLVITRIS